jgi:hypothetical protein
MVCVTELLRDENTEVSVDLGRSCLCCRRCVTGPFVDGGRLGPGSNSRHACRSSWEGDSDDDVI